MILQILADTITIFFIAALLLLCIIAVANVPKFKANRDAVMVQKQRRINKLVARYTTFKKTQKREKRRSGRVKVPSIQ